MEMIKNNEEDEPVGVGTRRGERTGFVSLFAYNAAMKKIKVLKENNAVLEERIQELEDTKVDGRRGRHAMIEKQGIMGQTEHRNKVRIKDFVKKELYPSYKRLPKGWEKWSVNHKTPCARVMSVVKMPPAVGAKWYWETYGASFFNTAYVELESEDANKLRVPFKGVLCVYQMKCELFAF